MIKDYLNIANHKQDDVMFDYRLRELLTLRRIFGERIIVELYDDNYDKNQRHLIVVKPHPTEPRDHRCIVITKTQSVQKVLSVIDELGYDEAVLNNGIKYRLGLPVGEVTRFASSYIPPNTEMHRALKLSS